MKDYQIKIYIASENDNIDSICNKFNIDQKLLLIFNPLLKHKVKITNTPIKIPYQKEKNTEPQKEERNVQPKENLLKKHIFLLKTYLMYKILFNMELSELIQLIYLEIEKLNSLDEKNNYYIYLQNLFEFIDNYQNLDENKFLFYLNNLETMYLKIDEDDNLNQVILRYLSELKNKNYESGELWFYNYLQ